MLTLSVGALLAGATADRFGRKRTIQLGALIGVVGEWHLKLEQSDTLRLRYSDWLC